MRIIAGRAKGRRLFTPSVSTAAGRGRALIRPTSDRTREALFSILGSVVDNASVLDLFAGTGALGLEALSRGAHSALFVDQSEEAVRLIRRNVELCGLSDVCSVLRRDLAKGFLFLRDHLAAPFSLIFADPPYGKGLAEKVLDGLAGCGCTSPDAVIVIEENAGWTPPSSAAPAFSCTDMRRYGDTGLWFFSPDRKSDTVSPPNPFS